MINTQPKQPKTDARLLRALIVLYVLLLVFEGVFRKWVLPSLSNELLVVRDPILLLIYMVAIAQSAFPFNVFVATLAVVGAGSIATGMTVGIADPVVVGYGFDACFLHLPLMFVIPNAMNREDVIRLGRVVLLLLIPMSVLMAIQFRSSADAWINCGAGGGLGGQLRGGLDKIRPPGFFTFITGASQFISLASAFVVYGLLRKGTYKTPLLLLAGFAVALSAAVSSSRLVIGGIGLVFVMLSVIVALNRESMRNVLGMLIPIGLVLVVATNLDIFHEGRAVFEDRLIEAGDIGSGVIGTAGNWTQRVFGDFYGGFAALHEAPLLGRGLGVGTNVGASHLTGQLGFLVAEGEWARVILELGPILGGAYLAIRVAMAYTLFQSGKMSVKEGNFLPILLFGSAVMLLLNGQFGQSTTAGFAVVCGGLCLASTNVSRVGGHPTGKELAAINGWKAKPKGRSIYAQMLHNDCEKD